MQPLHSDILPGGIVFLKISGNLTKDTIPGVKAGIEQNLKMIQDQYLALGGKVPYLVDMSEFTGVYDAEILELFAAFAKGTRDLVAKATIYGGSLSTELIAKMIVMISGRNDMEVFHTKEEALAALNVPGVQA